jgi:hypothetical protein
MPDEHARDVGDRVPLPRPEAAERNAQLARAEPLLGLVLRLSVLRHLSEAYPTPEQRATVA